MVGAGTFACRPAEIFDEIAVAQLLFPEPLLFVFVVYLRLVVSVLFLLTNRLGEFQLFGVVLLLDGVFGFSWIYRPRNSLRVSFPVLRLMIAG